jgi:hypothetical protein
MKLIKQGDPVLSYSLLTTAVGDAVLELLDKILHRPAKVWVAIASPLSLVQLRLAPLLILIRFSVVWLSR